MVNNEHLVPHRIILQHAIAIAEDLICNSVEDTRGCYWATMDSLSHELRFSVKEHVYSGNTGIALFLLRLYQHTKESKYLIFAIKAIDWTVAHCKQVPSDNYSLFTGRMGVVDCLLSFYEVTNNDQFLRDARQLAQNVDTFVGRQKGVFELLNGVSGTLLGLLNLHNVTKDESTLNSIALFSNALIDGAIVNKENDVYWDRYKFNIRPLCGLSHGNSGVGYAFLELGNFLNNPALYWVAEKAFAYETKYWNRQTGNWPDFRSRYITNHSEYETALLRNEMDIFHRPMDMAAWCHGAPGIGLARLRAFQLTKKEFYWSETLLALNKTKITFDLLSSPTLCHGKSGNASLFIEVFKETGNTDYLEFAQAIAGSIIESRKKNGYFVSGHNTIETKQEDHSLFMGNAGIGYFFLQILDPVATPSILTCNIRPSNATFIDGLSNITIEEIQRRMTCRIVPRYYEMCQLNDCRPTAANIFDCAKKTNFYELLPKGLRKAQKRKCREILDLAFCRYKLEHMTTSFILSYVRTKTIRSMNQRLLEMPIETIQTQSLKLSTGCELFEATEPLSINPQSKSFRSGSNYFLAIVLDEDFNTKQYELQEFYYCILSELRKTMTFGALVRRLIKRFEIQQCDRKSFTEKVFEQVRIALQSGLIVSRC